MKNKLNIISCSRADYGLLKKLIFLFRNDRFFETKLVITGSHFSKLHGNSINEIKKDKIKIDKKIPIKVFDGNENSISNSISTIISEYSKYLLSNKPKLVIILGDRYEILAIAIACLINRIPLAHIHGGEITYGAIDDAIRHSLTKLSNLHFVANKVYKKRVIQLGESKNYIFNYGGLGVDAIQNLKLINKTTLEKLLKFKFWHYNFIVTYHPVTYEKNQSAKQFNEILKSIRACRNIFFIFTFPNTDQENNEIINKILNFCKNNVNTTYYRNLGQLNFLSLLKECDGIIGNSSSGLLEAPTLNVGTINIGNRQNGRLRSSSVIDVRAKKEDIIKAIKNILSKKFKNRIKSSNNPYGNGGSSLKIYKKIKEILKNKDLLSVKNFKDIAFKF